MYYVVNRDFVDDSYGFDFESAIWMACGLGAAVIFYAEDTGWEYWLISSMQKP